MYYMVILALISLDQAVKHFIRGHMSTGDSIPVIEGILHITYINNSGGAFSILQGQTAVLLIVPAVLTIAIILFIHTKRKSGQHVLLLSLSLISGGGMGNFIDRARMGYVVDFIDFRVFPIFNAADIFVCCGCGLMIIYMIFFERRQTDRQTA